MHHGKGMVVIIAYFVYSEYAGGNQNPDWGLENSMTMKDVFKKLLCQTIFEY